MGVSKVVYGGQTILDLTGDTVAAEHLHQGITAHGKDGELITGTNTWDSDTTDATANTAEILDGQTAYARGAKLTGTMPNNAGVTGTISEVAGTYTIPVGYHDGSGSVSIDADEQAKIVARNIRQGVVVLGVEGTMSGSEDVHAQMLTVTPTAEGFSVIPEDGYNYLTQVVVNPISYVETDNSAGGKTVTIATQAS